MGRGRTTRLGEFPVSFHTSQVNCGNSPKHCHICHVTLYSHTVRTGPVHTVPPLLPTSSTHVGFFIFLPSFLLTSSPLTGTEDPPLAGKPRGGVVTLFFTTLVRLFFFFFCISDRPFSPTCTRSPAPSSRVAFTASPLPCRLRYASRRPRRLLPHAFLATRVAPRHASPGRISPPPHVNPVVVLPSPRPLLCRPLCARRPSPHAPPPSHVTRPPCRVALSPRVSPSARVT